MGQIFTGKPIHMGGQFNVLNGIAKSRLAHCVGLYMVRRSATSATWYSVISRNVILLNYRYN